jgi:CheY-like chemotaxis protein
VLIADDDANDVFLLRHAFAKAGLACELVEVTDGQQAVDYLSGQPPFNDRTRFPLPDLVLLDLKMPRLDGFDVLAWLHDQPELSHLRVVVLSSSGQEADQARARSLGASDYHVKPSDISSLTRLARDLRTKWLSGPKPAEKAAAG